MSQKLKELKQAWKWNLQGWFLKFCRTYLGKAASSPLPGTSASRKWWGYHSSLLTYFGHFTPERNFLLWAKPGLLLESPTSPTIFFFTFFYVFGGLFDWFCWVFFLMCCICRCNQMLQLLVPIHFQAWSIHTCLFVKTVAGARKPHSHLNWVLVPFYAPIKQHWKKAFTERRSGP